MASTSMSLGPHWEKFIKEKVNTGEYGSATEVVREALREMKSRDDSYERLKAFIKEGEDSGYMEWDPEEFKRRMRRKYAEAAESEAEPFKLEN